MKEVSVIYMDYNTEEHKKTLVTVETILKNNNVNYSAYNRKDLSKKILNVDLVIVIGGDGTFLRTSHFVDDQLILGVNSDVKNKEGFLLQCTRLNFETVLLQWLQDKHDVQNLIRLKCKINSKEIDEYALNEIYIGKKKPYQMSRYNIKVLDKTEDQKSSGILIGTPHGSNAWIKSAGGEIITDGFEYIIREPYDGKLFKHFVKQGVLNSNEKIIIKSKMNDGIIVLDALSKEYSFKEGDKLIVSVGKSLNYIKVEDTPKH